MPTYYIMDLFDDMPTAVAKEMPSAAEIAACRWLPDDELAVYAGEYERNGFQGGLNWYRSRTSGAFESELQVFSGTHDRRAVDLHLRKERLGRLPAARRAGKDAERGLHADGRRSPARRRRTLGAAGAIRSGEPAAGRVSLVNPNGVNPSCTCGGCKRRLPGRVAVIAVPPIY